MGSKSDIILTEDQTNANVWLDQGDVKRAVGCAGLPWVEAQVAERSFGGSTRVGLVTGDTGFIEGYNSQGFVVDIAPNATKVVRVVDIERVLTWNAEDDARAEYERENVDQIGAKAVRLLSSLPKVVPFPFIAAFRKLVEAQMDGARPDPAFRVRLDADTKGYGSKTPSGHLWRILVRPAEEPLIHDDILAIAKIADECELSVQHSSAGLELRFPGDVS